jgi:uncharacterized membrane protein
MPTLGKYALAIAALLGAAQAQATQYRFSELSDWTTYASTANGISSNGNIAGGTASAEYDYIEYGGGSPTVWSGGKQTVLDSRQAGQGLAVNDAGVVVGYTRSSSGSSATA